MRLFLNLVSSVDRNLGDRLHYSTADKVTITNHDSGFLRRDRLPNLWAFLVPASPAAMSNS